MAYVTNSSNYYITVVDIMTKTDSYKNTNDWTTEEAVTVDPSEHKVYVAFTK